MKIFEVIDLGIHRMLKIFLKKDITILSNNCAAGFIYHRYGLRFNSPTVNLQMSPKDFLKYVQNIEHYSECEIAEISNPDEEMFKALGGGGGKNRVPSWQDR